MPVYCILNTCFRELIGELEGRELLYTEIAQSIFRTLIMYVFRLVDTTHDIAPYIEMNRIIDSATAFIERNFRKNLTLDSVAEACFTNKYYLSHLFSQVRKMTVWDYILERRVEEGKRLLAETGMTVAEAAEKSGFRDPGYFGRVFRKATGMRTPPHTGKNAAARIIRETPAARLLHRSIPERKYSAFAVENISIIS